MIKVTVSSSDLNHVQGIAKATGKQYSFYKQSVYFHTLDKSGNANPYPEKGEVLVEKDAVGQGVAYAPGEYILHPASLYLDRNGNLAVAPRLAQAKAR